MEELIKRIKEYFSKFNENNPALDYWEKAPFLPIEFFTQTKIYEDKTEVSVTDLDILKSVIADLMLEHRPLYDYYSRKKGDEVVIDEETGEKRFVRRRPEDIQGFRVINHKDGDLILQAIGADENTKINISNREKSEHNTNGVPYVSFDELKIRIAKKIEEIEIKMKKEALEKLGTLSTSLDVFEREYKKNDLRKEENERTAESIIESLFARAFDYYKYLNEYKNYTNTTGLIINQRSSKNINGTNPKPGPIEPKIGRTNDLIDFPLRDDTLRKHNPKHIFSMGEEKENGEFIDKSYFVYVYRKALSETDTPKDGWLFVAEPVIGNRSTRLFFLDNEEFEKFDIGDSDDRLGTISKFYLDMAYDEFTARKGTLGLYHTDFDSFEDKINVYINGAKPRVAKNSNYALARNMRKLYSDPRVGPKGYRPRTPKDIGAAGLGGPSPEKENEVDNNGSVDRTAQDILKSLEEKFNKPVI